MARVTDATEAHLPGILDILNHMIRHTDAIWTEMEWGMSEMKEWFDARCHAGYPVLVALEGDEVLGYCSYAQFRTKDGYRHSMEHTVYVAHGYQNRGIGDLLLSELIKRAQGNGVHVLIAGIDSANEGSIRFHQRHGFTEVGRLPQVGIKHGRWLDLVFLQLLIQRTI